MAKNILTPLAIKGAKPGDKERLLADGEGLFLRIRPNGSKDWILVYSFGGKRRKLGLGSFDRVPLSLARTEAAKAHACIAQGEDPQFMRKQREAAALAEREALEALKNRSTVESLFNGWLKIELSSRKDKGAEIHRSFMKDVLPRIGHLPAAEVTRPIIAHILDKVVERGAPIVARNLLGDIRQMYGFGILRGLVENDPTARMKRDDWGKKVERDRFLDETEIKLLVQKLPNSGLIESSRASIWIMLGTCCRIGELCMSRWEYVDLEAGKWNIPKEISKTSAHTIYLSPFVIRQFRTLKLLSEGSPWVLPAKNKQPGIRRGRPPKNPAAFEEGHVCPKSLTKQLADRQRVAGDPMSKRTKKSDSLILPGGKWTPHDLRRSGATLMGTLGVRPDIIEKCLNHVEQNKMMRIYQRQSLQKEQAEAWAIIGLLNSAQN